jgi:D-alanine transaminase
MADPFPTCWLNGDFLPLAEARISPLDRGFLFADGAYEVVPVHRGRPFRMRQHLERFDRSLRELRIRNPLPLAGWAEMTDTLVAAANEPELLVYLQVTRGEEYGRNHLFPPASVEPTGFAFVSPYPQPARALLERGLAAVALEDTRWARATSIGRAARRVLLRQEAQDRAARSHLTRDGRAEGSSSTVHRHDGKLVAAQRHSILPGTSRDAVIELAAGWLPVEIRTFSVDDMLSASEVWIASAGRGVLPVTSVDGKAIGTGTPGATWLSMYTRLQQHLDAIAARPALVDE